MPIFDEQIPGSKLNFQGKTPPKFKGSDPQSTLHYQSSLNNQPSITRPASVLDLDGKTPPKYLDNPPQ